MIQFHTGRRFAARAACSLLVLCAAVEPLTSWARVELGAPAGKADATIGCMFPMTGRAAIYGRDSIAGMKLALADLARDGTPAPTLRVLIDDTRSKASYAVRIAEDFIHRDGARFLCGMVSSGVAHAVSQTAQRNRVIMVGTDHASSRLTIEAFHKYYFRVSNDSYTSMAAGARYLAELQRKTGWKRLAFIAPDYDYGHVSWIDLRSNFERLGVKFDLVGMFWPKLYEPDYSPYIDALQKAEPEIVVTALWGGDFIAFMKQAASTDFFDRTRLANFDTGANYEVMVALGDKPPKGLIVSARHHNNWPETERNRRFVNDFHKAEGRFPTYAAEGAYSGIMMIAAAIRKAGSATDTDAIVAALEGLHLQLPEDPDGFTSYIDPDTHQIVQMQAVGEVVPDDRFPPARVMVGNWTVYRAEDLSPPPALVRERRSRAAGTADYFP